MLIVCKIPDLDPYFQGQKCQVFGNFLTFKWQLSGGSGSYAQ